MCYRTPFGALRAVVRRSWPAGTACNQAPVFRAHIAAERSVDVARSLMASATRDSPPVRISTARRPSDWDASCQCKLGSHRCFSAAKPTPPHPHSTPTPGLRRKDHLRRERTDRISHSASTTSSGVNGDATVSGLKRPLPGKLDSHRYLSAAKPTAIHSHPTPGLRRCDHLRRERADRISHSASTTSSGVNGDATV
jgi:hypothetical protein